MCAGPFGHRLLEISPEASHDVEDQLLNKHELLRPGFVRITFEYYWTDAEVAYVIDAVNFIAEKGWLFLPVYNCYPETAEWKHETIKNKTPHRRWLHNVSYRTGAMAFPAMSVNQDSDPSVTFRGLLAQANIEADKIEALYASKSTPVGDDQSMFPRYVVERGLRFFVLPSNVISVLRGKDVSAQGLQITPRRGSTVQLISQYRPLQPKAQDAVEQLSADTDMEGEAPVFACPLISSFKPKLTEETAQLVSMMKVDDDAKQEGAGTDDSTDNAAATAELCMDVEDMDMGPSKRVIERSLTQRYVLSNKIPPALIRLTASALSEFGMIRDGDKVLLGLSGGKDSLTMLHVLLYKQQHMRTRFELAAVTMNPNFPGFDPSPLIPYMKSLGVPYFYESQQLMDEALKCDPKSICSWCSRMKRTLYLIAGRKYRPTS